MSRAFSQTVDEVMVYSDADTIFRLASDVRQWPAILAHYRSVRFLGEENGQQKSGDGGEARLDTGQLDSLADG